MKLKVVLDMNIEVITFMIRNHFLDKIQRKKFKFNLCWVIFPSIFQRQVVNCLEVMSFTQEVNFAVVEIHFISICKH